jgi:hypothetical protein
MTLDPRFSSICGFTIDEFERYFSEYLPDFLARGKSKGYLPAEADLDYLKKVIIDYYDGYSWDGKTRVLNSFSLMKAFDVKQIEDHWFQTGTPSYFMKFLKFYNFGWSWPENPQLTKGDLGEADIESLSLVPLLFQSGYLTIDKELSPAEFLLKSPNQEVSEAMGKRLFACLVGKGKNKLIGQIRAEILSALENFDSAALAERFREILLWNSYAELKASEGQCQAVIFSVLKTMLFEIKHHQSTSRGEYDILICLGNRAAFVCEAKYEPYTPVRGQDEKNDASLKVKLAAALKAAKVQMSLRKYEEKYSREYQIVKRVAIGFAGQDNVAVEIY